MDTLTILKGIRKLLNSPDHWIKGQLYQTNTDGTRAYCLVGALMEVCDNKYSVYEPLANSLAKAMNIKYNQYDSWRACVSYNNKPDLKYSGMRARLDRAIKRLEARN